MSDRKVLRSNTKTSPQETTPPVNPNTQVYMVFNYYTGMTGITKCVRGVYLNPEEAADRQKELIPEGTFGINGSRCGRDIRGMHTCAFTDVFPLGAGDTDLHTTSVPNWGKYA
jgi:hypothetical protein